MATIQIHYDGDLVENHRVSLRTLGKTLVHLQSTMDRAFLEMHYGRLRKHSRMQQQFYKDVELIVQDPRDGGYILDFLSSNEKTKKVIDRVSAAINSAVEKSKQEGLSNSQSIADSLVTKKMQVDKGIIIPKELSDLLDNPDKNVIRKYGDRAVVRELDQVLSIIRSKEAGDSTFELFLSGSSSAKFEFNRISAKKFHSTISQRELGDPVIYEADVTSMDRKNLNGKIYNPVTETASNIIFNDEQSFQETVPFFDKKVPMKFIGSPFIEYGAFDPFAGDIYYIPVALEN